MIHVLLASSLPLAAFFLSWLRRGRRVSLRAIVLLPLAGLMSGLWAVVPDLPRLWRDFELYVDLHHRRYCDAWWLHCTIDRHDDIDSSMVFPVLFVLAALSALVVVWRELRLAESER